MKEKRKNNKYTKPVAITRKANSKLIHLNPTISVITFNINVLNLPSKMQ